MAKRFYQPFGGGDQLRLYIDPEEYSEANDQAALAEIQEIEALSDNVRAQLGLCNGFGNLADYDEHLEEKRFEIEDRLDYYSYDNRTETLNVRDGAWFSPEAIESFCGEDGSDPAANSIDGNNSSVWRHSANERHSIVYRLRSYPKKITRVRFRFNVSLPVIEQMVNLDIRAAKALSQIDEPRNLLEQGLNIDWGLVGGWVEHTLATPKFNARYIKLEFDTNQVNGHGQIREFEVRVETREP